MFNSHIITEWFSLKRRIFSKIRVIIINNIAFIYASMGEVEKEKNWARINLNDKKSLDEFEWCG